VNIKKLINKGKLPNLVRWHFYCIYLFDNIVKHKEEE